MSRLERLQKFIIVLILLLALIMAGGIYMLLQNSSSPAVSTEENAPASDLDGSGPETAYTSADASDAAALTETLRTDPDHLVLGQDISDLSFTLPEGGETTLADHLGDSLSLIMFWGSWCSYCSEQTSLLVSMEAQLSERGVTVILIDKMDPEKESIASAKDKLQQEGSSFDWIIDQQLTVYNELGLHIIPTTLLVDSSGHVLYCHAGSVTSADELTAILDYAEQGPDAQTLCFVQNHLTTQDGGIQLHVQADSADSPSGQDVLAESQGLIMEYAALNQNDALFASALDYTEEHLESNGLLRWYGTQSGATARVNALLDDLRVLRAMNTYQQLSGKDPGDMTEHAAAIALYNIDGDGNLVDFYTFDDGTRAHQLTMCYADWTALAVLEELEPYTSSAIEAARNLVNGAYLGDDFPFYANNYDYETGRYDDTSLNMAEAMLTLLHQAEADSLPEASLQWLRTQMEGDGIWARYDTQGNVVPGYEYQSPAIYAIAGMIALECEDDTLLTQAMYRMEDFRCFDTSSPLNGAFADSMENIASFDQCTALVLYSRIHQPQ